MNKNGYKVKQINYQTWKDLGGVSQKIDYVKNVLNINWIINNY